jgi:hypothetical protein
MKYFWYYRPEEKLPPPSISFPSEIGSKKELSITYHKPYLSTSEKKKWINEWINAFPSLENIRIIWLNWRVNQEIFDAICKIPNIEGIWIKCSNIENLECITAINKLQYFHLGSSPSLVSIEILSHLKELQWLGLENIKKIRNIQVIGKINGLVGLSIEGSMWTTQKVKSLIPIGKLRKLRFLSIANLRSDDKTLSPLYSLNCLETFITALWWNTEEFEEIKRRNPKLREINSLS